jgi:superfamily I DNA/RNA helicase
LADAGDGVTAETFHDFCLEVIGQAGAEPPVEGVDGYWELLVEAALAAMPRTATRYDAILVDEAQDFQAEWWLMIEDFLADADESTFHIFIDDHQNLYGRSVQLPFTQPECRLRRNCRNTGPIAKFARGAVGLDRDVDFSKLPAGPEPVVHQVASAEEEWDAVRRVLHELVQVQGVDPGDVVVLGCHKLENSSFAGKRKLGNLTLRDVGDDAAAVVANSVRYSTVHKFKGLEAECVLLTGIGGARGFYTEEHWRRFLYVGGGAGAGGVVCVWVGGGGALGLVPRPCRGPLICGEEADTKHPDLRSALQENRLLC